MRSLILRLGRAYRNRQTQAYRLAGSRPDLETLEDRCVPSAAANQHFVENLYQTLLGRPADHSGLQTWTTQLNNGISRTEVVQQIEQNDEYKGDIIAGLYARLLNRALDPSGLQHWTAYLDAGHSADQLEAQVLGSSEYFARRGGNNNAGWLQALSTDLLGHGLDAASAQSWSMLLTQGFPRNKIAASIQATPQAEQFEVAVLYNQLLQRTADANGLAHFTTELEQGATREQVTAQILGSDEYFIRF
jgi:hypothetical protein